MKKRLWAVFLTICLVAALLPTTALAADSVLQGYCGGDANTEKSETITGNTWVYGNLTTFSTDIYKNVSWRLEKNGTDTYTLTLSGSGKMADYLAGSVRPWNSYASKITKLIVEDGVSSVGSRTCYNFKVLTDISLADTVTDIGEFSFSGCSALVSVDLSNVTSIRANALRDDPALSDIQLSHDLKVIDYQAFRDSGADNSSISIPASVTEIGFGAFDGAKFTNVLNLPNVKKVGAFAFSNSKFAAVVLTNAELEIVSGKVDTSGNEYDNGVFSGNEAVFYTSVPSVMDKLYCDDRKNNIGIIACTNGGSFASEAVFNEFTLAVPQKDGYAFAGWFSDPDLTEKEGLSEENGTYTGTPTTDIHADGRRYYAKWSEIIAEVDGTGYTSLADAVAAANGKTIKLLKDAELTSTLNLAKNITIDGQGKYTIKAANNFTVGSDNKTCCVLYVSGEVTLKDVTVNGNEKCRVIFCDKGKLTIDGATITNGKAPNFIGGVYMTSSASFEMKSGSITGNKNAELYQNDKYLQYSSDLWIGANANGALTAINGGTIGNVFVNANAWSANNPGSFTMNGGTVTNLYVEHDAGYGATFKYNDGTIEHLYLSNKTGNGQSIEVTPVKGVTYNGGVKEEDLVTLTLKYNDGATADTTYNVASGTTITLPTPKRSGYTFNGWYDGSTKVSNPYTVSATATLNASWSYISSGSSSYDPTYSVSTPSKTEHGTVTVSPKSASKGDTVTVTVKPDSGYVLETLTVTDKNGNELTLKDKGNGKYTFTMPAGKVEVKATFMDDNTMLNFFVDVKSGDYYYDAVLWAAKNGITSGTDAVHFSPEQPCTRAQIVTFLWRAAGAPEPKAMSSFADVSTDAYYAKAVAWAVENGITTGTGDGKFSPDATCTRAQSVTFLFRAIGKLVDSKAEFSDVLADSYYANAVDWAVENGVTNGIGDGLFGPNNSCTRAQIVTFLYRAYQGK